MNLWASIDSKAASAFDFTGQAVLIANACDAIGAALGNYFASRGAAVVLCGPDVKSLDALACDITTSGGQVVATAMVSDSTQDIDSAVDQILVRTEKIDILVNNFDDAELRPAADLAVDGFRANIEAMLIKSFRFMHAVLKTMRARRYGRIINIYKLAYLGLPGQASVAAAHAGLFGLSRSIALEAANEGVTVNAVVQGDIGAPDLPAADAKKLGGTVPVKRLGTPADIAYAVGFFASPAASYVTGQTLFACGGKSAYFSMSV